MFINCANVRYSQEEYELAHQFWGKAVSLLERLVAENPKIVDYRFGLALVNRNLAESLIGINKPDKSLPFLEKSHTLLKTLITQNPRLPQFHAELSEVYLLRGSAEEKLGRLTQALTNLQEAVRIVSTARTQNPEVAILTSILDRALGQLGSLHLQLGAPLEAAKKAYQRKALCAGDSKNLYEVACELARAAAAISPGKPSETPGTPEKPYITEVLAILREAIDRGFQDFEALEKEPALEYIRNEPGYAELLKQ